MELEIYKDNYFSTCIQLVVPDGGEILTEIYYITDYNHYLNFEIL